MKLTDSIEGWRCGDGVYEVRYKLIDMFYHNYDPITEIVIYPDLKIGELFKARASILRWHEDVTKILRKVIESPVFGTKDFRHPEYAMKLLGDVVLETIKIQAEPRLKNKYVLKNKRMVINPEWEPVEAPELIRDDLILEKFKI